MPLRFLLDSSSNDIVHIVSMTHKISGTHHLWMLINYEYCNHDLCQFYINEVKVVSADIYLSHGGVLINDIGRDDLAGFNWGI